MAEVKHEDETKHYAADPHIDDVKQDVSFKSLFI